MQGIYYKTLFRNQKTGEAEFDIIPSEKDDNIELDDGILHCKGIIGIYSENTPIEVNGEYDGKFYKVSQCFIPYKTKENVKHILEHVTKELTDSQIEKIANECKGDLFKFISSTFGLIFLARTLRRSETDKYVENIVKKIKKIGLEEELVQELLKYGVPIDKIEVLNEKEFTLESLDNEPYIIFLKYEIGIEIAEKFAQRNKEITEYSLKRLCGFTYDAMIYLKNSGHTCVTLDNLTNIINLRLKKYGIYENTAVTKSVINLCIHKLSKYMDYHIIDNKPYIYLNYIWQEECNIVDHVYRLSNNKSPITTSKSISEIEEKLNITYNEEQKEVFKAMQTSGLKILTGPPGSGKTAVIRGLIEYYNEKGVIRLAATTGMAAKVMKDACKYNTETVNMMLNVFPFDETLKGKDLNNPINASLIIVDEISMCDLQLFSVLVQAVQSGSILLIVGDENQLQSVGYGNVLHDLIKSNCIETYRLKKVIRQSGTICENANRINNGNTEMICDDTFILKHYDDKDQLFNDIRSVNINKSQILCPVKKKDVSTKTINKLFIKEKNPFVLVYGHKEFHLNDRIIMTKTNYEKGYVNGDIGYVIGCDEYEHLMVIILNKTVILNREDLQNIDFAYAITIHKSQGSEFENVYIILPDTAKNMMSRRLLYTAVTRTKKKVYILSMGTAFEDAISNIGENNRYTLLSKRLSFKFLLQK